ncbi:MAG: hypothetical protein EPO68_13225 [Planctomycetota bacterium]|nr:MAG: hypothetical protein EPO68_13225 [Planctomycetota bacterium]
MLIAVLGTCAALALVAAASTCAARPWIDVRTQPLELSTGELVATAPLVQQLPAATRGGPRRIEAVECAGTWHADGDPGAVRLRLRESGAADALREATGARGSTPDRVRFELGGVALDPEVDYELELAPSGAAERVPFAPLLRPRARLGARTRGEGPAEPLAELELAVHSAEADLSGIALPLARCPGGWTDFELLDADSGAVVRNGSMDVSPAGARALVCAFPLIAESRARDYRLRVRFEQPHTARTGRRGTANTLLHGAPLERGPLGSLRRGTEAIAAADLVLRVTAPPAGFGAHAARPRGREIAGLGLLLLAALGAWICAARRPPPRRPEQVHPTQPR